LPDPRSDEDTRARLRRVLRQEFERMQPPLRTLAEDILAEGSRIDLVTLDPLGAVVVVLLADRGEDLAGFTRAQAQVSWVRDRIPDWRQLAPERVLASEVHGLLLCPDFQPETLAAARIGQATVRLARYRDPDDTSYGRLVEPIAVQQQPSEAVLPPTRTAEPSATPPPEGGATWGAREPFSPPGEFRSGLSELDLQLSHEELREFS
jgi:hypothetical protein